MSWPVVAWGRPNLQSRRYLSRGGHWPSGNVLTSQSCSEAVRGASQPFDRPNSSAAYTGRAELPYHARPMLRRSALSLALLCSLASCRKQETNVPPPAPVPVVAKAEPAAVKVEAPEKHRPPADLHNHGKTPLKVCEAHGKDPLDAARDYYDGEAWQDALACAAQASALNPDDAGAHSERASALSALERFDEAKLAYARALALDPELPDALLGAAHLYTVSLSDGRDLDELGLLYSERGLAAARRRDDLHLIAEFATLSAMAFNDLGMSERALDRADEVLEARGGSSEASYERALALFELCRFAEAKRSFTALLTDPERAAHSHHYLALLLEREGRSREAQSHFLKAQTLRPEDFPPLPRMTVEEFQAEIDRAIAQMPADMRRDLSFVPVKAEDLPAEDDLIGNDPPLSPTILGLYRGPPLGTPCIDGDMKDGACRSVVLYRLNLIRSVKDKAELIEQIHVTLHHEVGHLRGEDDLELAARGLE